MADAEERHVEDRLEDARTFLWNAFGLDLDHINSDGKMRSNTRSYDKLAEIDRERSLGRTMADNLDQVFRHLVSRDEFGHITWQGFMAKIAEDLLRDYNWSLSHYERMFTQHPPRVEAEPIIREVDTEALGEERPRRRFTPLHEEEPEHPTAWDKFKSGFRTQRRRDIED